MFKNERIAQNTYYRGWQYIRKTLVKALNNQGYIVYGTPDGEKAMQLIDGHTFDLIVTDVRLPGGREGVEVAREIKQRYPGDLPKIIVMTGYANEDVPARKARQIIFLSHLKYLLY